MYPRGFYYYTQQARSVSADAGSRTPGRAKAVSVVSDPMAELGMFVRLGGVIGLAIAAVSGVLWLVN